MRKSKWNLNLPLDVALKEHSDWVVSLSDSQVLRFIDELNGVVNADAQAWEIKYKIRQEKKKPRSKATKNSIASLYQQLYDLQYQKDYICIVMDRNSDYDRANKGFTVNGVKYHRFLGTNGGIKHSTIVYVSERLYPELKKRLDNGRNKLKELVPAKLEAYQALICSGSTPIPKPDGIIVVNDCITHFKDDVILINDETDGEPIMTFEKDYEIEHNDSDGFGLMLPSYSRRVNEYLTGDGENTISGMNTRYAWDKGMLYTFDYIEFGRLIAHNFEIIDAWGDKRDVRCAEVILTTSMLKLWDSYDSWEDYYHNCEENHYQFSTPKITPEKLENVRNTNYQFLQSYDFSNDELYELCQPTIDEIKGVLGLDYRKSITFLAGFGLNERNVKYVEDNYIKALMIDKRMINDPYIRKNIHSMIKKRIELAKKGSIKIDGNFAMISGDPYALAQSMFGLEVTGLLQAGELYHKYWIDKGSTELACFRAPMTCHNNIRKMKLVDNADTKHWYQYITTAIIFNAWDTACDAMNGADKDGDTNMDTDNPIIVKHTLNSPTIMCVQRKAEKKVVSEDDIVQANKLAFNDDIGTVTNHVTSMIEVQAGFPKDSEQYNTLAYRIMCGQLYQQNTIDRAKGIIAKPMPRYWYDQGANITHDDDSEEEKARKKFNMQIVASRKPYFMTYIYPNLKKEHAKYIENSNAKSLMLFGKTIEELKSFGSSDEDVENTIEYYDRLIPVGTNPCTVNRICWIFEDEFNGYLSSSINSIPFDYQILKSGVSYTKADYNRIFEVYQDYLTKVNNFHNKTRVEKIDKFESVMARQQFVEEFKKQCEIICPNEKELCDIVLDICYLTDKSKQFAWDICGEVIIENLLEKNNYVIHFPVKSDDVKEFEYCGEYFKMDCQILERDDE